MNLLDPNPNKRDVSVVLDKKGNAESDSIDPDQGLIDASKVLVSAIEKKDAKKIARAFKAMMQMCYDEIGSDGAEEYGEQD